MDEDVADKIHKTNSKILAEVSKKITQSINEMKKQNDSWRKKKQREKTSC